MLSEEQIRKLISLNESLLIQLEDANAVLKAREKEVEFLQAAVAEGNALRSKLDCQLDEIEKLQYLLYKKDQQATGAEERELELQEELTDLARLNTKYNQLVQDYAYLSSRFNDVEAQLTALNGRNSELQQIASRVGELESRLENTLIERADLMSRITTLESQKYLREFN